MLENKFCSFKNMLLLGLFLAGTSSAGIMPSVGSSLLGVTGAKRTANSVIGGKQAAHKTDEASAIEANTKVIRGSSKVKKTKGIKRSGSKARETSARKN